MLFLMFLPLLLFLAVTFVLRWLFRRYVLTYLGKGIILLLGGVFLLLITYLFVYLDREENAQLNLGELITSLAGLVFALTGLYLILINRFQRVVYRTGLFVALPLTGLMMLFYIPFQAYLGPHRSRVSYKFFFSQYKNTPYKRVISHFPKKIPQSAKDVHFFHQPHFMMGGMTLQLRYVLPKREIESLLAESLGKAKQVVETGGDYISPVGPNDLVIPSLRAGERGDVSWPKGYKIMTFDGKSGNHGFGYGVAISIERNEAVYWAEDW